MNQLEWSKDSVLLLIEQWKAYPCLYDSKHPFYSNKLARHDALTKMAIALQWHIPGIGAEAIKTKLSYLRGQYSTELRKIKNYNYKSGMGSFINYEPSTYWFEKLNFLNDFIKMRKVKDNLGSLTEDSSSSGTSFTILEIEECSDQATNSTQQLPKEVSENDKNEAVQPNEVKKYSNDVESYGEYVKAEISPITDDMLRAELKNKISNIIFAYKRKQIEINKENDYVFEC